LESSPELLGIVALGLPGDAGVRRHDDDLGYGGTSAEEVLFQFLALKAVCDADRLLSAESVGSGQRSSDKPERPADGGGSNPSSVG